MHAGDAVTGLEEITGGDLEADRGVPEVPADPVPHADGEAERVASLGERQRSEPADEMPRVGAIVAARHWVRGAEADDRAFAVVQLELHRVGVFGRPPTGPQVNVHDLAGLELARRPPRRVPELDAAQMVPRRR